MPKSKPQTNPQRESEGDPYLQVLVGIVTELELIRRELQSLSAESRSQSDSEVFECRCGETLTGEDEARHHAREEHKAPRNSWMEMYE